MKLGILGIFRFGYWVVPDYVFGDFYVGFILLSSSVFLLCSRVELDVKRWLAFLRLAHIGLVPAVFRVAAEYDLDIRFSYCLGHGVSSCVTFGLF